MSKMNSLLLKGVNTARENVPNYRYQLLPVLNHPNEYVITARQKDNVFIVRVKMTACGNFIRDEIMMNYGVSSLDTIRISNSLFEHMEYLENLNV